MYISRKNTTQIGGKELQQLDDSDSDGNGPLRSLNNSVVIKKNEKPS